MKVVVLDAGTLGTDTSLLPLQENFDTIVYQNTLLEEVETRCLDADIVVINKIKMNNSKISPDPIP